METKYNIRGIELILSVVRGRPGVVGAFVGPGTTHKHIVYKKKYNIMHVFQEKSKEKKKKKYLKKV